MSAPRRTGRAQTTTAAISGPLGSGSDAADLTPAASVAAALRGKRSKYGARPTVVDGVRFASRREADRYVTLCWRVRAGEIRDLELQPRYPLHAPNGAKVGTYVADFRYVDADGVTHVEDAKGMPTPLYRWKRRHVEAEYGLLVEEV